MTRWPDVPGPESEKILPTPLISMSLQTYYKDVGRRDDDNPGRKKRMMTLKHLGNGIYASKDYTVKAHKSLNRAHEKRWVLTWENMLGNNRVERFRTLAEIKEHVKSW